MTLSAPPTGQLLSSPITGNLSIIHLTEASDDPFQAAVTNEFPEYGINKAFVLIY